MTQHDQDVRALDAARWRVALTLTGAMVALYFGFILLVAYGRDILAIQPIPGLSLGKSGDEGRPKPNRRMYRPIRSAPTFRPILIAPTLLDLTITSVNESGP